MKLTIPFYLHKAGAGFPSPATDYIEDDIDLNSHLITNAPATFIIRVQGKSMVNVGIYDGDLLIVDKSIDPRNFSTVIANVNEELVVKTLIKEKGVSYLTSGSKNILDKINNMKYVKNGQEDYNCWLRALNHTDSVYVKDICFYYDSGHGDGQNY